MNVTARIVADRLYGITMRPQELAMYGEHVDFDLRYTAIFDDAEEVTTTHFSLLVLEASAVVALEAAALAAAAPDELPDATKKRVLLVKCGWELERETSAPMRVGTLPEAVEELPRLLERIADTVNELARRAKLEAPFGPELITTLLHRFRTQAAVGRDGP